MKRIFSEEHKRKLSESHKGQKVSHSEETKRKISESKKGHTFTQEAKDKIRNTLKSKGIGVGNNNARFGVVVTEETRRKMSEAKLGNKREAHTKETKMKISQAHMGMVTYVASEDTKAKMRKSRRAFRELYLEADIARSIKAGIASQIAQGKSKEPTSIEKAVYDYLVLNKIVFEKQKVINGKYVVDAYIPNLNLVIEADGIYWHSKPISLKRDKIKDAYLKEQGFNLIRLPENEIRNGKFQLDLEREFLKGGEK